MVSFECVFLKFNSEFDLSPMDVGNYTEPHKTFVFSISLNLACCIWVLGFSQDHVPSSIGKHLYACFDNPDF